MINSNDPWEGISVTSMRRITESTQRNLFWIRDQDGNKGFLIKSDRPFANPSNVIQLYGIDTVKRNVDGDGELILVLREADDWEIFLIVCKDLISEALESQDDASMVDRVEGRLKRWQRLLSLSRSKLTPSVQMGLFAELECLAEIVAPKIGLGRAVKAWVGPEADRQDFLFDSSAIEVKSYRVSKGDRITISSAHQLNTDKDNLFLLAYGVTPSESGSSVATLAEAIHLELVNSNLVEEKMEFEDKLARYGYFFAAKHEKLSTFIVDKVQAFEIRNDFPRLIPNHVPPEIVSVKYVVDLSLCRRFAYQIEAITF